MEVVKVKDWLLNKDAQFKVLGRSEFIGENSVPFVSLVFRIKDKMLFRLNEPVKNKDYPHIVTKITKFHDDLIHVTIMSIDITKPLTTQKLYSTVFEIDSLVFEDGLFKWAIEKL